METNTTNSKLVHSALLESHHDIPKSSSRAVLGEPVRYNTYSLQDESQRSHEDKKNQRMPVLDSTGTTTTSNNFEFQTERIETSRPGSSSISSSNSCGGSGSKTSTSTPWHAILYGQLLSVALTVSSATSLALNNTNSSSTSATTSTRSNSSNANNATIFMSTTPTFSLFCMYLLLAVLHFSYWLYCQRQERQNAITALILSNLTSAVDCTLDDAYHTWADKRHSILHPNCNNNNNNNNSQHDSLMMIVEQTDPSPSQSIDMELDLIQHYLPVSRYKFINISCSSTSSLNLHSYSWKQYCALAFLHVQGNYCLLKSFQYESFKTVVLLQSISIPAAIITSAMFLRRHYTILHIIGAILCISGSAFTFRDSIFSSTGVDTVSDNSDTTTTTTSTTTTASFPNPILIGDLLAISSAILSGISDVFAEQAVKYKDSIVEYLAMIGFFGTIISFIQVVLLELPHVLNLLLVSTSSASETASETSVVQVSQLLLLSIFTLFSYMYYAGMSRFLLFSEATFLNLSMLSTDLWSIGFSIFQEHMIPSYEFFLSFVTIAAGVFAYQKAPSPIVTDKDGEIELDEHHEDMEEPHSMRATNTFS